MSRLLGALSVPDLPVREGCTNYCVKERFQSLTYPYVNAEHTTVSRSAFSP
ncbi:hypothetical protein DPMN_039566 [Dreissena polymorpha]|uniref:Uncharacterized protein n=1 Tax=Dreissena polymorpha TaxID=45954 RepID=A0A9D4CTG2_DREPO|nr:hypothetical protein DPMN_039566 [Dreissena polymorpha]